MLNVNALQKTLSAMSLPEIQKYAQLHKNDPYVVSMALSVANTKKEAQTAQQGLAGVQPMPKVAEQDIAAIAPAPAMAAASLPESVGIGQLPAQNIQGMAEGGIVAFAGGGDVYDGGGYFDPNTGEFIINEPRDTRSFGQKLADAFGYKKGLNIDPTGGIPKPPAINPQGVQNARDALLAKGQTSGQLLVQPTIDTVPTADTGAGKKDLGGIKKDLPSGQGVGFGGSPMQAASKWFESQLPEKEAGQTEEDYLKKRQAVWEPVNTKLTEMVEAEKNKLKTDKEENIYMALIQGGLAAAGGNSQYALQNIAQGFGQGAKIYGEGLKDLRLAAKEINKMEMDQQKALAAQKIGDMDAYEKYTDKIADRNAKIDQLRASGLGSIAQAAVSGEYSLAGHRESASAYRENAKAYKEAQTEQRDIGLVEQMRKNIDAVLKDDPAFKLDAAKREAEVNRRLQDSLKNYPRLLPYAGLSSIGQGGGLNITAAQQALLKKYGT